MLFWCIMKYVNFAFKIMRELQLRTAHGATMLKIECWTSFTILSSKFVQGGYEATKVVCLQLKDIVCSL